MSNGVKFPELCPGSVVEYVINADPKDQGKAVMIKLEKLDRTELMWAAWMLFCVNVQSMEEACDVLATVPASNAGLNGVLALGKLLLKPEFQQEFRMKKVIEFTRNISSELAEKLQKGVI